MLQYVQDLSKIPMSFRVGAKAHAMNNTGQRFRDVYVWFVWPEDEVLSY
jgi:hypothetical protein